MQYTPGPWEATKPYHKAKLWHIDKEGKRGGNIATVWGVEGDPEANARLIASAPELLEACKTAEDELTIWLVNDECDCPPEGHICGRPRVERHRKELQQAITKAEVESE